MKVCLKCDLAFHSEDWVCPSCAFFPPQFDGVVSHAPEFLNSGGGFKVEYFDELESLESANFWFQARNEFILWALRTYKPSAQSFLEVGCGTGFVLSGVAAANPDINLCGSEIFLSGLTRASERTNAAEFMQMDARCIPFEDEFDVIGAFDVLEHIKEDDVVLSQLYKALVPGGGLLLTVPQHPWLWSVADEYACHERRYSSKGIEAVVKKAGFEILRSTSFVTSLLPAMMLSRFFNKQTVEDFDPVSELKIHPIINKVFYRLMRLELFGIKHGLNYAVGGSRLLVAKKSK